MLVTTAYLPPISFFKQLLANDNTSPLYLEAYENYQKRSYRNRAYLSTANKIKAISVPLVGGKNDKHPIQSVSISYDEDWIKLHIESLHAAYGKSAFFIHYIDEIEAILNQKYKYLFDLNLALLKFTFKHLYIDKNILLTDDYQRYNGENIKDKLIVFPLRAKLDLEMIDQKYYAQVFEDRYGFIRELTILDLLFCMGPEAKRFLYS